MAAPLLFLVNPAAGRGRGAEVLGRLRQAARRARADLVVTASAADVTEQARRAVEAGVERLVVAGGDGTAHHRSKPYAGRLAPLRCCRWAAGTTSRRSWGPGPISSGR